MASSVLGSVYQDGDVIIRHREKGHCRYVVQSGTVEVIREEGSREVVIAELGEGDFFGEMALFEKDVRSATVRAKGEVTILTVDRKTLLGRIQKDPTLAFRLLEKMSSRVRELNRKYTRIRSCDRRDWETRPESFRRD
ncbi:MAG: cyclic nucleotide-binding domain-containing protein [Planctomycetota bacterium]|jgi:CRP-like cAMP-binding protein